MQEGLFTLAKLDDFVPPDHPLRAVHALVNEALVGLNGLFNTIYAETGRASIAPEKLLRAMLIQVLFSVRSERQLTEQVRYNRGKPRPCSAGSSVSTSSSSSP